MEINPIIIKALHGKATMHLDIIDKSRKAFDLIKNILAQMQRELNSKIVKTDKRLKVEIKDRGPNEIDFTIASDTLIFILHSNHYHTIVIEFYNNLIASWYGMHDDRILYRIQLVSDARFWTTIG